jgi:hypothetical protein
VHDAKNRVTLSRRLGPPSTGFASLATLFGLWLFMCSFPLSAAAPASDHAGLEFFEKKIRPLLVENCYKCHSAGAEKIKGGFLLDTREGMLKGGDTGPAIVPGEPEKSLLIKAVRYTDDNLQMPPKNQKLAAGQIADLEAWIKMGAPDPRTLVSTAKANTNSASKHWAFQAIKQPALPAVKNKGWIQTPVDAFILAKLEEKKIRPSPPADKRTFIRRATFDLLGLPPTPQEVNDYVKDKSSGATARLIDRLLASPRYGERWGRYWLDVARYADTKGYVFEEERRYPYAYTYRDYVIRSLNEDLPFDQFITQQIAADLLPLGEDKRALAALGFLTLGRRFLNNQPDIIDDRLDVVTRGMMGLTVTCARCHDHKFDPIPTKDYYSLYGVFASCSEPANEPLLGKAALPKEYPEYLAEREKRETERNKFREEKEVEARAKLHSQVGDYLLLAHDIAALADKGKQEALTRERKLDPAVAQRWINSLQSWTNSFSPIFAPWFALSALGESNFQARAQEVIAGLHQSVRQSNAINPAVAKVLDPPPASLKEAAERYGKLFADVDHRWTELSVQAKTNAAASAATAPPSGLPDSAQEALRQLLYADSSPTHLDSGALHHLFDTPAQQKLRALQRKVDELDATHPGAPPRAMALADNASPVTPRVFLRGNPANPGEEVPRQFLQVIAGKDRLPFQRGSGRLELAQDIASPQNPLTARVLINRVWLHHFGAPLVRTPSDFGLRSEPPTHPELLDYLAARFMAEGWSLKKLHRWVMLSSAYQQSSANSPESAKVDPANQLLWRMNRSRLDFEALRDTLLMVAGKLDLTMGGRPVDLTTEPSSARRTVYGFVERQNLPGLFRTFDFASPDTTSPQRFSTTVPQQALFLMNSPFVAQQASNLLHRPELGDAQMPEERRIQQLYQIAFQRLPDSEEMRLAKRFLHNQAAAPTTTNELPSWQYGWGWFDEKSNRTAEFHRLPHFSKYAWQGGEALPDPALGWVLLNEEGGHPGNDPTHAAIRRWTAPRDGVLSVRAVLEHPSEKGDGVRARLVSSRKGLLGEWFAFHGKTNTCIERIEVHRGDTLDFVTDCRGTIEYDSFNWAPVIQCKIEAGKAAANPKPKSADERQEWNAKSDFSGPPVEKPPILGPWEKYAQVLLLANELVFVD